MDENNIVEDQGGEQVQAQSQESTGDKIVSTAYKVEGWQNKIGAVINYVVGAVFLLIGGIASLLFKSFLPIVIASPIIIGTFLGGWYYWRRGKVLVREGKFSAPWKVN
jgi:hypothetical protein